jgi:hypothetical protein
METLQQFQSAVRENGFIEVGESRDGSAAWFRKATPDANTSVHKRLCIDSLTNSATVFWETAPTQMHSRRASDRPRALETGDGTFREGTSTVAGSG